MEFPSGSSGAVAAAHLGPGPGIPQGGIKLGRPGTSPLGTQGSLQPVDCRTPPVPRKLWQAARQSTAHPGHGPTLLPRPHFPGSSSS